MWLTAAWAEVSDMPAEAFLAACKEARRIVDHPAKLVPAIIREGALLTDLLNRRYRRELASWENRNAPRIPAQPEPWEAEREEVAALMADLRAKLAANGE